MQWALVRYSFARLSVGVLSASMIVNAFSELNHRSETVHCSVFCHFLVPILRAMARLIVEAHNCRVYLSSVPADVHLSAKFAALSHSVVTPSEVSTLRVRARAVVALDDAFDARSKLLDEKYFEQHALLYEGDFDLPDMMLSESLRIVDCDERRRWTGNILSAVPVAGCRDAHAALHLGLDNIYRHVLRYVRRSFDYETHCAVLEGLCALGEITFPSLRTARKCLNDAFTLDARERHAETAFVHRLRRDGLCLCDVTGLLYPRRVENALNDLSEFRAHV